MNGGWWFLIVIVVLALAAGGGYIGYTHYRARKLGLPPPPWNPFAKRRNNNTYQAPAPAPNNIKDWFVDKWQSIRGEGSGRTTAGGYESSRGGATSGRRGFGPLDPDEAWDARVDNEASGYYEEQELGLHDPSTGAYGGGGYGRGRQPDLDDRYDEEMHGGAPHARGGQGLNPFGDDNAVTGSSLRSVSPRPEAQDTTYHGANQGGARHKKGTASLNTNGSDGNSPTERRSMFTEDLGGR